MNGINIPTVPIKEAEEWTENWRISHGNLSRAFLIPAQDLLAVLFELIEAESDKDGTFKINANTINANIGKSGMRAYMAISPEEQKLLLVGAKRDRKGIFRDIVESGYFKPKIGSGVFDFTTPCPTVCDPDSPLN